jgi:phospholipid/cholesterol/gamma-HCH transport system substrate-binding protein
MKQSNLEIKVGLFVIFGLVLLGGLVVVFGRFDKITKSTYDLYLELPNASGLLKNSQVLYRGAKVGTVTEKPEITKDGQSVIIICRIDGGILIDQKSRFKVGVNGLLGDRFVDVIPSSENSGTFWQAGDSIKGEKTTGIADIGEQVEPILKKLDGISRQISEELLTEEFINDIHDTMKSAKSLSSRLDAVLAEAQKGKTPLGAMLYDQKTADQLKKMISDMSGLAYSLRKEGPLFYKDVSDAAEKEKAEAEAEKAKAGNKKTGR